MKKIIIFSISVFFLYGCASLTSINENSTQEKSPFLICAWCGKKFEVGDGEGNQFCCLRCHSDFFKSKKEEEKFLAASEAGKMVKRQ